MIALLLRFTCAGLIAAVAGCASTSGGGTDTMMEEFHVPSDPGIQIYVRNKRPAGMNRFSSDKTVLFVHGATYPARPPST